MRGCIRHILGFGKSQAVSGDVNLIHAYGEATRVFVESGGDVQHRGQQHYGCQGCAKDLFLHLIAADLLCRAAQDVEPRFVLVPTVQPFKLKAHAWGSSLPAVSQDSALMP